MAGLIEINIVTPEKEIVKEDAQIVVSPGLFGEFGALIGHTPFITFLKTGVVRFKDKQGNERRVFISGGISEVLPEKVTILAETAEKRRDIDLARAKAALDRATKRMDDKNEEIDFTRAKAALERAVFRIKTVESS